MEASHFDDPDLAIDWPIDPSRAIMSEKDHRHPTLKEEFEAENPFVLRRNLKLRRNFLMKNIIVTWRCRIHRL